MSATITHDPGVTEPGQVRKYAIEVTDDDWAAFAELLEELTGEQVSVTAGDALFTFQNARERLVWADAFRTGEKVGSNASIIVDWLTAWIKTQTEKDELERDAASRRVALCAEKMSPRTLARAATLAQALTHWRKS